MATRPLTSGPGRTLIGMSGSATGAARVLHDVPVPFAWRRVAGSIAVAGLVLLPASACGRHEQGPNADPQGLFPQHFSKKGFVAPGPPSSVPRQLHRTPAPTRLM